MTDAPMLPGPNSTRGGFAVRHVCANTPEVAVNSSVTVGYVFGTCACDA